MVWFKLFSPHTWWLLMNSCFKLPNVLDNYSGPIATAFDHLTSLMAFTLTVFPEMREQR